MLHPPSLYFHSPNFLTATSKFPFIKKKLKQISQPLSTKQKRKAAARGPGKEAWEEGLGNGAAMSPCSPQQPSGEGFWSTEAATARQPSCLQRGSGRVEVAQVWGSWGWRGVSEYL